MPMPDIDNAGVAAGLGAKVGAGGAGFIALMTAMKETRKGYHEAKKTVIEAAQAANKAGGYSTRAKVFSRKIKRGPLGRAASGTKSKLNIAKNALSKAIKRRILK